LAAFPWTLLRSSPEAQFELGEKALRELAEQSHCRLLGNFSRGARDRNVTLDIDNAIIVDVEATPARIYDDRGDARPHRSDQQLASA
jgi:hypothetical protein